MEESIYNLLPSTTAGDRKSAKGPRYVSKFAKTARKEAKDVKQNKPLATEKPNPHQFLKKQAGIEREQSKASQMQKKTATQRAKEHSATGRSKSRVPKASEKPVMGITSKKNYIKENAVKAATAQSATLAKTKRKEESEMEFTKRSSFGKTPEYLKQRKEEDSQRQAEYEEYVRTIQMQGQPYQVPESERQELLRGLKTNWDRLYHDYQGLSVVADTIPKKQQKTRMEAQLAQLEEDIKKIERHRTIYVQ
eukprot:m.135021 g.135021  ORF g.135021 m.135021 type:complete len:250 (-) comp9806_c0_seq1:146-895(-)